MNNTLFIESTDLKEIKKQAPLYKVCIREGNGVRCYSSVRDFEKERYGIQNTGE